MAAVRSIPSWANPDMLRWARRRVGLDPRHIASLTKDRVSEQQVIAWESSQAEPSLADLEHLARLYRCPLAYFFWDRPPQGQEVIAWGLDLRGVKEDKAETLDYETRLALIRFRELAEQGASIVRDLGIQWQVSLDSVDVADVADVAVEFAEIVAGRQRQKLGLELSDRDKWATADELFTDVRRRIENMGVFIIALKVNSRQVRGASLWTDGLPPAILVNRADVEAATGRLFTLLHEYVHLLLRKAGVVCDFYGRDADGNLESLANKLAASILVPRHEGRSVIEGKLEESGLPHYRDRWSDAHLDKLRRPFKVSRHVIAIVLEEYKMARPGFYRQKLGEWEARKSGPGFGRGRALTLTERKLMEFGSSFSHLLREGHQKGHVSLLQAAHLLDTTVDQAQRFLEWPGVQKTPGQ